MCLGNAYAQRNIEKLPANLRGKSFVEVEFPAMRRVVMELFALTAPVSVVTVFQKDNPALLARALLFDSVEGFVRCCRKRWAEASRKS